VRVIFGSIGDLFIAGQTGDGDSAGEAEGAEIFPVESHLRDTLGASVGQR